MLMNFKQNFPHAVIFAVLLSLLFNIVIIGCGKKTESTLPPVNQEAKAQAAAQENNAAAPADAEAPAATAEALSSGSLPRAGEGRGGGGRPAPDRAAALIGLPSRRAGIVTSGLPASVHQRDGQGGLLHHLVGCRTQEDVRPIPQAARAHHDEVHAARIRHRQDRLGGGTFEHLGFEEAGRFTHRLQRRIGLHARIVAMQRSAREYRPRLPSLDSTALLEKALKRDKDPNTFKLLEPTGTLLLGIGIQVGDVLLGEAHTELHTGILPKVGLSNYQPRETPPGSAAARDRGLPIGSAAALGCEGSVEEGQHPLLPLRGGDRQA